MATKSSNTTMSPEELERLVRETATPIDFDELEQAGVLERRGGWYAILKIEELPSHARTKIKSIKQNKKKEVLVKSSVASKNQE